MFAKAAIVVLLGLLIQPALANELPVVNFSHQGLSVFREKSFFGFTQYQLVDQQGKTVLQAVTNANASALYRELDIDLERTPFLNWRWRVDNTFDIDDQKVKTGDDYPARVYVVIKEGFFPWQTKALNYIWSNRVEAEHFWPNPFTAKAIMIPVRSGAEGLGRWHTERVNVAEDFYRIFGRRIDKAHGVAIMSDSDNAKGSAVAYYGDIVFSD